MKADFDTMLRHLHLLFDSCGGVGLAEIAFGCPAPNKALLSRVDELDRLAGEALLQNGRGYNTYIGACVRDAHTAPFARAKDRDVIAAPAVVVDLDLPGRAENAEQLWGDTPPSFCVVTGLTPHKRMQCWWLLDTPCLSLQTWSELQRAMAAKYDGDTTVTNPSRVMRLAGSLAQPVKEGRVLEPTFLENVREPLPRYTIEQLREHCDAFVAGQDDSLVSTRSGCGKILHATENQAVNSLGLGGKIIDGREHYMRDTVLACLRQFIGENGCAPTPRELYQMAWPQYEEHAAIEVPGKVTRGQDEMLSKVHAALQRFHRGDISSMRDLDAAVASHKTRNPEPETFQVTTPPPAANNNRTEIKLELVRFELRWCDPRELAMRDWLYGTDYIRGYTSCTVAPGAAGKSSLLTVEALAMVTGKPLLGITPSRPLGVFMWNGEDPREEMMRRVVAAIKAYGLTPDDLGHRLFMASGRDMPLKLLVSAGRTTQVNSELVEHLIPMLRGAVDVLILDPLVAIHTAAENDNVAMDALVKALDGISERAKLATMVAHHSRKTNGQEVTTEDARGASALMFAARSGRVINTMTQDEANRVGVKNRRRHFRLENGKLNMAVPPEKADWFELRGELLGNGPLGTGGDNVAVVFQWKLPDVFEGMTGQDTDRALWELRSGAWLVNPKANNWAGISVARTLGLDLNDISAKARVKMMLKRWEKSGALRREHKVDPITRHMREFYEVVNEGDDDGA